MADEVVVAPPEPKPQKPKKEKVSIVLTGGGSVNIDGITAKNGEVFEIDSTRADRFLATGLFERK